MVLAKEPPFFLIFSPLSLPFLSKCSFLLVAGRYCIRETKEDNTFPDALHTSFIKGTLLAFTKHFDNSITYKVRVPHRQRLQSRFVNDLQICCGSRCRCRSRSPVGSPTGAVQELTYLPVRYSGGKLGREGKNPHTLRQGRE